MKQRLRNEMFELMFPSFYQIKIPNPYNSAVVVQIYHNCYYLISMFEEKAYIVTKKELLNKLNFDVRKELSKSEAKARVHCKINLDELIEYLIEDIEEYFYE